MMGGRVRPKDGFDGHIPWPKVQPSVKVRDASGEWRKATSELADRLGYFDSEVWRLFLELAAMREFESYATMDREVHEAMAFGDVEKIYDKCGNLPC